MTRHGLLFATLALAAGGCSSGPAAEPAAPAPPAPPAKPGAAWELRADIPQHVYGHGGAILNGKYHVLGGCPTKDWTKAGTHHQVYDPATDTWKKAADLPIEVGWPMPAVFKGKIYLFGGQRAGAKATEKAWSYDPAADAWSPLPDMPKKITNGFAIAFGDAIYLGQGYNRQGGKYGKDGAGDVPEQYKAVYRFDPTAGTYTRVADAPEYGIYSTVGVYRGAIYIVAGVEVECGFHNMADYVWSEGALKYVPATDTWTKINAPRGHRRVFYMTQNSSCAFLGSKLYVVGGMEKTRGRTTACELFDMEKEAFEPLPEMPDMRCCGGGGVINGRLYIAGGFFGPAKDLGDVCKPTWSLPCR